MPHGPLGSDFRLIGALLPLRGLIAMLVGLSFLLTSACRDQGTIPRPTDSAQELAASASATPPHSGNHAPVAQASASPNPGEAGLPVLFDGSASTDADGTIASYAWNFGDQFATAPGDDSATGVTAAHTYTRAGIFIATLTVTDDHGATNTIERTVRVNNVVEVTVTGSIVAGVTVTLTDAKTGQSFVARSDASGKARFVVDPGALAPDASGRYIVSARRLSVIDPQQLQLWPQPSGTLPSTHEGLPAYLGVTHYAGQSLVLNRQNLKLAVENPLRQIDGDGKAVLTLQMPKGATMQSLLLDSNGDPFTLQQTGQCFGVLPLEAADDSWLPKVYDPNNTIPDNLQRAIGFGIATLAGQSTCTIAGVGAGTNVIETGAVQSASGETVVYRSATTVTETQVNNQSPLETVVGPSPLLAHTNYLFDGLSDNGRGARDIGELITAGWSLGVGQSPTTEFVVTTSYVGNGHYTLEIWTGTDPGATGRAPESTVTARCDAKRCELQPGSVRPPAGTRVTGVVLERKGVKKGTVTWRVPLPAVGVGAPVWFRLGNGNRNADFTDTAPNFGTFSVTRQGGGGNTWIVAGSS